MERFKRPTTDEMEPIVYEPRLTRVDQQEIVYIDKNEVREAPRARSRSYITRFFIVNRYLARPFGLFRLFFLR